MRIVINQGHSEPMYEQIKTSIKQQIYDGDLKDGDPLPSIRQLAKELNISMITTKRAYDDLEQSGLIYTIPGKGTFIKVRDIEQILNQREEKLMKALEDLIKEAIQAGIPEEKIETLIKLSYGGNHHVSNT